MRVLALGMALLIAGCALEFKRSACAPREMIEECLNEVATKKDAGMGPSCRALTLWARANDWGVTYYLPASQPDIH